MRNVSGRLIGAMVLLYPLLVWPAGKDLAPAANSSNATTNSTTPTPEPVAASPSPAPSLAPNLNSHDPLLQLLVSKGIVSVSEANNLSVASPEAMRNELLLLLHDKGVLSNADLQALNVTAPENNQVTAAAVAATAMPGGAAQANPQGTTGPAKPAPTAPGVVAAISPLRVLTMDPPKREGLIPDIKIGANVRLKPYGFFKTSAVYDSSNPYGNDFPLPAFIGAFDAGPGKSDEFHVKARGFRLGLNYEWMDPVPKVTVTGKFEMDFEGNFTRVNNRNITTLRSSQPSIRLAYGRVDYALSDKTTIFGLFGQDWTPFGSSTLPNLLESTGLGIAFGTLYGRAPQMRFGFNRKVSGSLSFQPEVAVVVPAYGNGPANLADQLGYGERQGVDSGTPEIEGRFVTQWQFDHAKGVAPAQLIFSGVTSSREALVRAADIPTAFKAAFPTGVTVGSDRYGYSAEVQLPTRYATLIAKYWSGEDMRFFLSGQLYSTFNDATGLTATATAPSVDGSSTVLLGLRNGVAVVAPQRPVRQQGGFVNLGIPISRLLNADPNGRNAGWVAYLHAGYDQALTRDVLRMIPSAPLTPGLRQKGEMLAGQLQYKLNSFVTFAWEESLYRTDAVKTPTGTFPLFQGVPTRQHDNIRTEVGTIFTF